MIYKIAYEQLIGGYEFAPSILKMEADIVSLYLKATGDENFIYKKGIVPPMAIVALAMAELAEKFVLLPGTVHVSQQLKFIKAVKVGETLTGRAKVNRKVVRGKFHMLSIGINISNQREEAVVDGEIGFILPIS